MAEFIDLLKKEMDQWIVTPQKIFNNQIPQKMADTIEGKKEMTNVFKQINAPSHIPLQYLYQRLELDLKHKEDYQKNPEVIAKKYLVKIIEKDYKTSVDYLIQADQYSDSAMLQRYIDRHESNRVFRKMVDIDLLSSALSEDKSMCLVYFDVNEKYDLTVVLRLVNEEWKIAFKYCGKPEIFNGENEAIQQVAVLLSKNDLGNVHKLLTQYSSVYPESADLAYYWGLYYAFSNDLNKSETFFHTAMELDNSFIEAIFNYANLIHNKKDYDKAMQLYHKILDQNPDELKSINNIGAIYLERLEYDKAEEWFNKCLSIDPKFDLAKQNLSKLKDLKINST